MKEMVGGCCVCGDERGWSENPLVYCDGQGCNVAVHQACYGITVVPLGPWFCQKCDSKERSARVRCELCPSKDGALKCTDSGGWAHVVCALYIPEVRFGNVGTMEPIILHIVPQDRFNKTCSLCEAQGKEANADIGACMQCNKSGCKSYFHVTCAQAAGLLCEEEGNEKNAVKYVGYCYIHYQKMVASQHTKIRSRKDHIKIMPAFKPIPADNATPEPSPEKNSPETLKERSRSKADRRAKYAVYNSTPEPPPVSDTNLENNLSDSNASTISNTSLNNGIETDPPTDEKEQANDTDCSKKPDDIAMEVPSLYCNSNEKHRRRTRDSPSGKRSPHTVKKEVVDNSYESFFGKIGENISLEVKLEKKKKKAESPKSTKKRTKHSRGKSKSSKRSPDNRSSNSCKQNPQIPIVRIKRKFNSDLSCSSHSVEEVSNDEPKDYESILDISGSARQKKIEGEIVLRKDSDSSESMAKVKTEKEMKKEPSFYDLPDSSFVMPTLNTSRVLGGEKKKSPAATPSITTMPPPPAPEPTKREPSITSFDELLEKEWALTSDFLMSQSEHFDVATMISSLRDLREENVRLEKSNTEMVRRRDGLLAVVARLKLLPLEMRRKPEDFVTNHPMALLHTKPMTGEERCNNVAAAMSYGYLPQFEHPLMHTSHEFTSKSLSPAVVLGTNSIPHAQSPMPIPSPVHHKEHYQHFPQYSRNSSPMAQYANNLPPPMHLFHMPHTPMHDDTAFPISIRNGSMNDSEPSCSTTIYQTISPPFSHPDEQSPPDSAPMHSLLNNIVFHPNYDNPVPGPSSETR